MIKYLSLSLIILFGLNLFGQPKSNDLLRGPQNVMPEGVIDGVVVKDEVPVRSRIEYEHVRLADYVWSKRLFSRIDSREKVNHALFYPFDEMDNDDFKFPTNDAELMDKSKWVRHQDRYSLWTIIEMHLIAGDLTLYRVNSTEMGVDVIEDGYQLKYPIKKQNKSDFYTNYNGYRDAITKFLTAGGKAESYDIPKPGSNGGSIPLTKGSNPTFKAWVDSLVKFGDLSDEEDPDSPDPLNPKYLSVYDNLTNIAQDPKLGAELERYWNNTPNNGTIMKDAPVAYITSKSIKAFNIKEDWFFDKERSMLDKRIIAIAPVGNYAVPVVKKDAIPEGLDRYKTFLLVGPEGSLQSFGDQGLEDFVSDPEISNVEQREMFWLYFPELRNVMVNYYVYNNQSDAQWMTFDDFFWKRMFSATIYRASDQFDREIEDYRYGVDALYEAEKIKETMRTWETDLWNY
jgi:hypothetical protein